MTRMTGPDCAVMRNLINTYTHTLIITHSHTQILTEGWEGRNGDGNRDGGGNGREDEYGDEHEGSDGGENGSESGNGERGENGHENRDEGGGEREPGNLNSGNRGVSQDARRRATQTSNRQPQPLLTLILIDATPQRYRRIMLRTRAQGTGGEGQNRGGWRRGEEAQEISEEL